MKNFMPQVFRFVVLWLLFLWGCHPKGNNLSINFQSLLEQVRCWMEEQNFDLAIQSLEKLELRYPHEPQILEALAFAYSENNQVFLAARTFEKVVYADISHHYQENALHAAQAYDQMQNFYSATRCYRLYLDAFPQDAAIWFALSEDEYRLSRPTAALQAFLKGMDCCKEETTFGQFVRLGQLSFSARKMDQSMHWYYKALQLSPGNVDIYWQLLKVAHQQNNVLLARKMILKIDDLCPGTAELCFFKDLYLPRPITLKDPPISPDHIQPTISTCRKETDFIKYFLPNFFLKAPAQNKNINKAFLLQKTFYGM